MGVQTKGTGQKQTPIFAKIGSQNAVEHASAGMEQLFAFVSVRTIKRHHHHPFSDENSTGVLNFLTKFVSRGSTSLLPSRSYITHSFKYK